MLKDEYIVYLCCT